MVSYFTTPEWQNGRGFRCYACGKLLAVKLRGQYSVSFRCPRCKSYIFIKSVQPLPWLDKNKEQDELKEKSEARSQ